MVTHGKNNQVTMISLSFSGVGCLFESEIWCIEDLSGHCWALIMEPCGVNCFLLEISQPVADVSAGYKWESPKSGFICPGGTASITQNVSQFPYHLFQKWSKKMLQVFPMNWDWQVIQKWLPSLCTPLVNLLVAKAIESFLLCGTPLPLKSVHHYDEEWQIT